MTQLTFSFAVAPFIILSFSDSLKAWGRVYYYAVVGVAASMAFFASPAKSALRKTLDERAKKAGAAPAGTTPRDGLHRTTSTDSVLAREPVLGLSSDPQREIDEMVEEIK